VIGGVCGGLGRYFNTDPLIFRIGAIALTFLGGAGLLLYLAALLLMPAEQSGTAVVSPPGDGRNRGLVIAGVVVILILAWPFLLGGGVLAAGLVIPIAILVGAGVLVWWLVSGEGPSGEPKDIARRAALGVGVLILCGFVALGGALATAAGPDWIVALLIIVAGAAILAGAFLKPVRWLVLPAIALALAAGTVSAAGIDLDGGVGDRDYRPASATDLEDRYQLGMGELVVDLRNTDLPAGDVPLELDLGIGEARLLVAEDVCVATTTDIGMGHVSFFGRDNEGIDVDFNERPDAEGDSTRILLDAQIGLGELRVGHDDFWDHHPADFGPGNDGFDLEESGNTACATTGQSATG
jgi:phage shock protein PspC (stress-responsive transcriptional regulator)